MDARHMSHKRLLTIAAFAVLSFALGFAVAIHGSPKPALADGGTGPPPPPCPTCNTGGGGGGGGGGSTTPPPHTSTPPGPVTDLMLNNHVGSYVKLSWKLPAANNLKKVYVLRTAAAACSSTIHDGTLIGSTLVRTSAVDKHPVPGTRYCYTVFVTNLAGQRSAANEYRGGLPDRIPPLPVRSVHAAPSGSAIKVTWSKAPTATHYIVLRTAAGACATSSSDKTATRLGGLHAIFTTLSATDTTAQPGQPYCYSVFPVDGKGNVQKTAKVNSGAVTGPGAAPSVTPTPPVTHPTAHATAARSGSRLISSAVAQIVAAVGVAVVVFGLIILGGLKLQGSFTMPEMPGRRRQNEYQYGRSRNGAAMRLHLGDYDTRALVIPAVLGVGLLLIVAAVAALVV